jgi:hypothetical protein
MSDLKPVKISGELFWTKWMAEFNKAFNEDNSKYECTIGMLSDEDVAKLTGLGIRVKYKDAMGNYIVAKSQYEYKPLNKEQQEVPIDTLGNGSKCEALVSSYKHKMSAKFGMAPSVQKLKVTEIKTYVPDAKEEDDDIL